jgi:hypothetical protein
MSIIFDWLAEHPKTHKVVMASPVVGAVAPIAMACKFSSIDALSNNNAKACIGATAGVQLLSCGIASTAAYLLWHHAAFAAVFKISAIFGGFVLGGASFFIAPAIILFIYLLCKLVGYLWKCCHPPSESKHSTTTTQPIAAPQAVPPDADGKAAAIHPEGSKMIYENQAKQ